MLLSELEDLVNRMRIAAKDENPRVLVYNPSRGAPYFRELVDYPNVSRIRVDVMMPGPQPYRIGDFLLDTREAPDLPPE